jgi:hypothetical protein
MPTAWFRYVNSSWLAMKPARSPHTTGDLPRRSASARTSSTTSGSVTTVRTSSTSGCTGAGLKKCIPTTLLGRWVRTDSSVIESDEVFEAKIVSAAQTLSRAANTSLLSSRRSGTASTTSATSPSCAMSVVTVTRSSSAARSSSASFPRETARAVEDSICSLPCAAAASVTSTATTSMPPLANTSTIPAPIVPRPTTPTRANSRATTRPFVGDIADCGDRGTSGSWAPPLRPARDAPLRALYRFRR